MTDVQFDERLARRVQVAGVPQETTCGPPDDKRDAVRPSAMQQDDAEKNPSSAEPSGAGDMEVEGHAGQTSAKKRLAEAVLQRGSDTSARSSNGPMPWT